MREVDLSKILKSDNALSQFNEDDVIQEILKYVEPTNKFFVEFGSDGNDEGQGNTAYLRRFGWDGLLMSVHKCETSIYPVTIASVNHMNVENLFTRHNVPAKFGFLSIDIDSQDYWVWRAITGFRADIVCIETSPLIDWSVPRVVRCEPDVSYSEYCGGSPRAFFDLARRKKYSLVARCGVDLIFIADEKLPEGVEFAGLNDLEYHMPPHASKTMFDMNTYRPENSLERIANMDWIEPPYD